MDIIKEKDLPVELSPHLRGRAEYFLSVRMNGLLYYIPVSKELKKFFDVRLDLDGQETLDLSFNKARKLEEVLSDIVSSVYLQIRDTVGEEIKISLLNKMTESLTDLLYKPISFRVDEELGRSLPSVIPAPGPRGSD